LINIKELWWSGDYAVGMYESRSAGPIELRARGIIVRTPSAHGVAEEAPGAYKDLGAVVDAAETAGLARKIACVQPVISIKG
jgi:RNA-splicing ligase RtcB